ncbi:MAG: Mur ligase family protein, partial [bacterium]
GGNMRLKATLPLLKKVKDGDVVVLELDSWQCQGFRDEKFSPEIAVFTSFMPDHMNYYKDDMKKYLADKQNIFLYQNKYGVLVANKNLKIPTVYKGKVKLGDIKDVETIPMHIIGKHNLENASYACKVGEYFGLDNKSIKKSLSSFKGLEGRLEYVGKKKGLHVINDNNATTPEATLAGVEAVLGAYPKSKIILIAGGADKKLVLKSFCKAVGKCKISIFLKGSGTDRLKTEFPNIAKMEVSSLKEAISKAISFANKNDVILFSPGFASFGMFKHEYDRNDQFLDIVKKLK